MSTFSVTEVRNALRCPRIFALGRSSGQSVAFPVGSSSLGAPFHRIVDRFTRTVTEPPAYVSELGADASLQLVTERIGGWLIRHLVQELDRTPAYQSMPSEVDDLAEALRELAGYLAARVSGQAPASGLQGLLRSSESTVQAELGRLGEVAIIVSGQVDSIHALEHGEVDVVEYKLTDPENHQLDRAQVALYRALLLRAQAVDATPVILRFSPGLTVTRLEAAEADALVANRIVPLLRDMEAWAADTRIAPRTEREDLCSGCPVRRRCAETYADKFEVRDAPPTGGARPELDPNGELQPPVSVPVAAVATVRDDVGLAEAEEFKQHILVLLRRAGVSATSRRPPLVGPRVVGVEVSVQRQVRALDSVSQDVIHCLQSEHDIAATYEKESGVRRFMVKRRTSREVTMEHLVARKAEWLKAGPVRFVVGEAIDGSVVVADLAEPASCHLLVGGRTGSGKSVFLRGLIQSLTCFQSPAEVQLTLMDPKRVSFGPMMSRGAVGDYLAAPICYEVDGALRGMQDLVEEMERRYVLIERANVEHVDEYNEDVSAERRLPHHVVIVDEFSDLMLDKATREPFETAVKRLGGKARAAGIHLVLATQRPEAKVVPGIIKANLTGKIALRVGTPIDSQIILAQKGAESLLNGGDLLADLGRGIVRAQAPLVR